MLFTMSTEQVVEDYRMKNYTKTGNENYAFGSQVLFSLVREDITQIVLLKKNKLFGESRSVMLV